MDEKAIIETLNEAYFSANPHEREVIALMPKLLKDSRLFLDIGASLGQFTKAASNCLHGGSIISVEADPIRHRELEKNCRKWSSDTGNSIRSIHGAASDRAGSITFQTTNSNVSGGVFQNRLDHLTEEAREKVTWAEVTVPAVTIDDVLEGQEPNLIKMDIEGAEIFALEGATKTLQSGNTNWLIELHNFADPLGRIPSKYVPPMMEKLGYKYVILYGKHLFSRNPMALVPAATALSVAKGVAKKIKTSLFGAT